MRKLFEGTGEKLSSSPLTHSSYRSCNKGKPFHITGVDLTGAIAVRGPADRSKAYIVLFTCAVTRAVHMEVVDEVSENEFLSEFIRFVSRSFYPSIIYSDNATNFVAAAKTLESIAKFPVCSVHQSWLEVYNSTCTLARWYVGESHWYYKK